MSRVRGIPRYFRFPWRTAGQIHREVDEELQFHLECRMAELRTAGHSPGDAERLTHREFGDLKGTRHSLKAQARQYESQRRRELMFNELFRDIRYAWRALARSPGFSAIAILVLALGIGANSAIFSLLNTMLMRPMMIEDPEQLVGVYSQNTERPDTYRAFSYPNYVDLREQNKVFSELAAHDITMVGLKEGDQARRIMAGVVSSNFFRTFGVSPAMGRGFSPEEELVGGAAVAVVSHDFSQNHGGPGVLGRDLDLNGHKVTVVGVMPKGFTGSSAVFSPQVWLPLGLYDALDSRPGSGQSGSSIQDRENHRLIVFGRLRQGLSEEDAAPQLAALAERFEQAYPKALEDQTFVTNPLPRLSISTTPDNERALIAPSVMLMAMAGVVLMIACLNLANMFLARGAARRTELAIRLSLGGGRLRLLRQMLSEGLVLSLLGGAAGLLVALYGTRYLFASMTALLPFGIDLYVESAPDWRVLVATLTFCVLATVLSGLGPAWKLSGGDVLGGLKETAGQGLSGGSKRRLSPRNLMVVGQIALSMVLLSAGGLFVRGALAAAEANPGFSLSNSVLLELDTSMVGYDRTQGKDVYRRTLERLRALPGVEAVGMSSIVPFGAVTSGRMVRPAGNHDDEDAVRANYYVVSDDYFKSLRLTMLQGRGFDASEAGSDTGTPVAVINEQLAEQLWPNEPAVGKILQLVVDGSATQPDPMEIVGVAPGMRHQLTDKEPTPHLFVPFGQNFSSNMHLHLRLSESMDGIESTIMQTVRKEVRALDTRLPILALKTFTQHRDESLFLWMLSSAAKIFTALGGVALFLALVGVYGVKAFMVTRRTREIGLRLALGATPSEILKQMVRESLSTTLVALGLGLVLALGTAKVMAHLIYDSHRGSALIIFGAAVLLTVASTLAAYLPARRATRIEPTVALRQE